MIYSCIRLPVKCISHTMALTVPFFLFSLFCSWFQCEFGAQPPYLYISQKNTDTFRESVARRSGIEPYGSVNEGPVAYTTLGPAEGYVVNISAHRQIYSFTGIPYGEPPERFRPPVPKKPWKGVLRAKSPSPFCIQASVVTMGMIRGEENCLYLDVHTPRLPRIGKKQRPGLPVLVWLPAGANMYGRSRSFGPAYLLREDIIFVPLNVRFGVFGYLSTGDDISPGNNGLKDQALAIAWVYKNIAAFGGDPNKIIVGGLSSGAYTAHLMLFSNHVARNYVAGIFAMSGTALGNHGLDTVGRVRKASNIVAKAAGCPTSDQGMSVEMVECLRNMDPYILATKQAEVYKEMPAMSKMIGPTLEPNVPGAFITELPEIQYAMGTVPPIPAIFSRAEDESSFILQRMRYLMLPVVGLNWYDWMPRLLQIGIRSSRQNIFDDENDEAQFSLLRINQFYFNKTTPPIFTNKKDFRAFVDMMGDSLYHAPMWKSVELHHKIAPTFVYLNKHQTFTINPALKALLSVFPSEFGSSHATDFILFFNNTNSIPRLAPGSDFEIASKNLINMIANFGNYGKPLYRMSNGALVDVWKPITDMRQPMVLEVGLVHNISMIRDPLPGSRRLKIWDEVKF